MKTIKDLISENFVEVNEAKAKKPKMVKVYRITNRHTSLWNDKERVYTMEGTLEELIGAYSYTLECGHSYEDERGNKKINMHPKTIDALCKNLNNAANNSARNGYSGDDYSWEQIGEKELIMPNPDSNVEVAESLIDEIVETDEINEELSDRYKADNFKVGDILDGSFHYSMKIPYFYKIVKRTAKQITVVELDQEVVSDDGYGQNGKCKPIEDKVRNNGAEFKGRITKSGCLKIRDCLCTLWDGKPVDFWSD